MSNFIDTIKNIFKIEELKNKILLTLSLLLIYRFGNQVVIPGVDSELIVEATKNNGNNILDLLNTFTGGAFAKASLFALGIMPYISASIVVQLMSLAIPYLQKLDKDGESGRKTKNQITRWLTIGICIFQAPAYLYGLKQIGVPEAALSFDQGLAFIIPAVGILVTGCVLAMWLGEKITEKGIGNGISLLIMVGILASLPQSFSQEISARVGESNGGPLMILVEVVLWLLVILASVYLVMAVRQVPVQYARRSSTGGYEKNAMGTRQYLTSKVNASGVMPIIFAQAIMFVPGLIGSTFEDTAWGAWMQTNFSNVFGLAYNILFAVLIIVFTYVYTAITVPTNKMADDLKT